MAFFAELLDTAREQPHELRAAKTILMLAALRPEPCELATVHAINSRLLLDDCDDRAFYDLIIHGRIRFRWSSYPDGSLRSPRQEFCERLGRERYFQTWPETRSPDGAGSYTNRHDVCEVVRRILLGDPTSTGIPTLDTRVSNANELFSAIEQSTYRKQELSRRHAFVNTLRASIADIPKSEEYDDLRSIIAGLASDETIDSRSNAWAAIETSRLKPELEAQAKDVVDAVYNSSIAHSLEADLLSTRRLVPLTCGFHGASNSARARIDYFDTVNVDERLKPLVGRQITWEAVRAALATQLQPLTSYGAEGARRALVNDLTKQDAFVSGMPALTAALGAAAGGLSPPALGAIGLAGALTGWAAIPLAMLGAGAFIMIDKAVARLVEKHRADQLTREMDGWLDITG